MDFKQILLFIKKVRENLSLFRGIVLKLTLIS